MESLTKEEKDHMANKRMEEMKRKNETLQKRRAEIEAENSQLGELAAPPKPILDDYEPPEYKDNWQTREGEGSQYRSNNQWGDQEHPRHSERGGRGGSRGRGRGRGTSMNLSRSEDNFHETPASDSPKDQTQPSRNRPLSSSNSSPQTGSYQSPTSKEPYSSTRRKNYEEYEKNQPNEDVGFLTDFSRQNVLKGQTNLDSRNASTPVAPPMRHERNYGGKGIATKDLRDKLTQDRSHRKSASGDPTIAMTGKERIEHQKWKSEQDKNDQERIARSKAANGWKRDWDKDKNFSEDIQSGSQPPEMQIYEQSSWKKLTEEKPVTAGDSRIEGSTPGQARGRGRPIKKEADTSPRKVFSINDCLTVTIGDSPSETRPKLTPPNSSDFRSNQKSPNERQPSGQTFREDKSYHQRKPQHSGRNYQQPANSQQAGRYTPNKRQDFNPQNESNTSRRNMRTSPSNKPDSHKRPQSSQLSNSDQDVQTKSVEKDVSKSSEQAALPTNPSSQSNVQSPPAKPDAKTTNIKPENQSSKTSPAKQPSPQKYYYSPYPYYSRKSKPKTSKKQEEEDEWVDCSTDEDFYEEDATPHVSKEATPARLVGKSKEGTPVPDSSLSTKQETGLKTLPQSDGRPPLPQLHLDIRDPIDPDMEDVEDVLKTPEGGRQHLDWAAEMEAQSPITSPEPRPDNA